MRHRDTQILSDFASVTKIVFVLVNSFLTAQVNLFVLLPDTKVCFHFFV